MIENKKFFLFALINVTEKKIISESKNRVVSFWKKNETFMKITFVCETPREVSEVKVVWQTSNVTDAVSVGCLE